MIKLIEEKHRGACIALGMAYGKETNVPVDKTRLNALFDTLTAPTNHNFIAGHFEEGGTLKGIVLVEHSAMSLIRTVDFSIIHVILDKSARGGQIYKALIDFIEVRCYSLGGDNLFVCATNHKGLGYYIRNDFVDIGTLFMKEI